MRTFVHKEGWFFSDVSGETNQTDKAHWCHLHRFDGEKITYLKPSMLPWGSGIISNPNHVTLKWPNIKQRTKKASQKWRTNIKYYCRWGSQTDGDKWDPPPSPASGWTWMPMPPCGGIFPRDGNRDLERCVVHGKGTGCRWGFHSSSRWQPSDMMSPNLLHLTFFMF